MADVKEMAEELEKKMDGRLHEFSHELAEKSYKQNPYKTEEVYEQEVEKSFREGLKDLWELQRKGMERAVGEGLIVLTEEGMQKILEASLKLMEADKVDTPPIFAELLGLNDETLLKVYGRASELFDQGHYQEALELFLCLIWLNPFVSAFFYGLGLSYERLNFADKAKVAFEAALTLSDQPEMLFDHYRDFLIAQNDRERLKQWCSGFLRDRADLTPAFKTQLEGHAKGG